MKAQTFIPARRYTPRASSQAAAHAAPQRRHSFDGEPASTAAALPVHSSFGRVAVNNVSQGDIQAKLQVSQPGDPLEMEADRVADQVMRMAVPTIRPTPLFGKFDDGLAQRQEGSLEEAAGEEDDEEHMAQAKLVSATTTPLVQRQVNPDDGDEAIQTKRAEAHTGSAAAQAADPQALPANGSGRPLDPATRSYMEPRFGHDFSQVRVHTDARAAESARAVNARAYTLGQDVVFGAGQYAPGTADGNRLLAHELAHVVQQGGVERSSISPSMGSGLVQRFPPAIAAMGAAEWIAVGAAGYLVAQDATSATAGDVSYTFDEMEGVLLPGGGSDVPAYRTGHPDADIQSYTHTVSTWMSNGYGSRAMGIKFGITFNYDGHAVGNISCRILDTYDWPGWSGSVNVNFTPLSLASGDVAAIRITLNLNADRTFAGGTVGSRILELDGAGAIKSLGSGAWVAFGE